MVASDQFEYFLDLDVIEKKEITKFSLSKRMPISGVNNNNNHHNNNNKCVSETTAFKPSTRSLDVRTSNSKN